MGYPKSKVFEANPLRTFQIFKQGIQDEIKAKLVNILREVMQNFQFSVNCIENSFFYIETQIVTLILYIYIC